MNVYSERPWLVAIPAGTWQLSGIRAAQVLGMNVLGIDADTNAAGQAACDEFLSCDINHTEEHLRFLDGKGFRVATAISFCSDAGIVPAARLRAALKIGGATPELSLNLVNKERQRTRYAQDGVSSVAFWTYDDVQAAALALVAMHMHAVVKPVDGAGSRGVSVVEARTPWHKALQAAELAMLHSHSGRIIVEEFIEGVEHTVELVGCHGEWSTLAVTEKSKAPGSRTVSDALVAIDLESDRALRLARLAAQAAHALGIDSGLVHAEVMWHPARGPVMIEMAGRGGGFMLNDGLVPLVSGVDPSEFAIRVALDATTPLPISANRPGALVFQPSGVGTVSRIFIPAEANLPTSVTLKALAKVGDIVSSLVGDGQRVAFALATGDDFHETEPLARSALSQIEIDYA